MFTSQGETGRGFNKNPGSGDFGSIRRPVESVKQCSVTREEKEQGGQNGRLPRHPLGKTKDKFDIFVK